MYLIDDHLFSFILKIRLFNCVYVNISWCLSTQILGKIGSHFDCNKIVFKKYVFQVFISTNNIILIFYYFMWIHIVYFTLFYKER